MSMEEVQTRYKEFTELIQQADTRTGDIYVSTRTVLTQQEFFDAIRDRAGIHSSGKIPEHLLASFFEEADQDHDGHVDFDEWLTWYSRTSYSEELMVPDKGVRQLRQLARKLGVKLLDLERVYKVFGSFDEDGSGKIDRHEFRKVLLELMKVKSASDLAEKTLERYWVEVDEDRSGEIDFEEFSIWYFSNFDPESVQN